MKNAWDVIREASGIQHEADAAFRMLEARDAEWRRLVEEAQATSTGLADVLKETQAMNIEMRAERDRLKGELAEARRLLKEARKRPLTLRELDAFEAATPAEQVQPSTEAEKRCVRSDCGRLESCHDVPFAVANHDFEADEQAQATYEDVRCARNNCGHKMIAHGATFASRGRGPCLVGLCACKDAVTPPPAAEQAQGEAAPTLEAKVAALDVFHDELEETVAALAKRVEELEAWRNGRSIPPAPPPPEAAGPAGTHRFVERKRDGVKQGYCVTCGSYDRDSRDHAVPPIPEGK